MSQRNAGKENVGGIVMVLVVLYVGWCLYQPVSAKWIAREVEKEIFETICTRLGMENNSMRMTGIIQDVIDKNTRVLLNVEDQNGTQSGLIQVLPVEGNKFRLHYAYYVTMDFIFAKKYKRFEHDEVINNY